MADKRFNERAYINRVEEADTDEFAQLLAQPTREEEDALSPTSATCATSACMRAP